MTILNYLLILLISSTSLFVGNLGVFAQVLNVSELSDVKSTDWAFQALQSLTERYQCISSNSSYRGDSFLTRYEFAAGIQSCINRLDQMLSSGLQDKVSQEDLSILDLLANKNKVKTKEDERANFRLKFMQLPNKSSIIQPQSASNGHQNPLCDYGKFR